MKDKITVSISSVYGTKHFSFGKKTRHTFRAVSYAIFIAILITGGIIYYLVHEAEFSKLKVQELENRSSTLSKEITSLVTLKENLERDLTDREEKMLVVSDRLDDLEKVLGMDTQADEAIESRLDTAAINSSMRVAMLTQIPNGSPVKWARISSGYGKRIHPITGKVKFHRGQDFAVNIGTPIYAPADGAIEVTRASKIGSGNFIRILHTYGFSSSYSHMSKFAVKRGDFVKKGDLIGYSGNTGLSSGPHLHYEVRFVGRSLDPKPFMNWNVDNFDSIFKNIRGIAWESLVEKIELRVSRQLQLSSQKAAPLSDNSN